MRVICNMCMLLGEVELSTLMSGLRNALHGMSTGRICQVMSHTKENLLIHCICVNAEEQRIGFLDIIPRVLVAAHSGVLIDGFVREQAVLSIPSDIHNLLCCFF